MHIKHIEIKNFRCFDSLKLDLDNKIVVIQGVNGVGKTTLLEALHYLCYLRSFRTYSPGNLLQFGKDTFFIKTDFFSGTNEQRMDCSLQVGFEKKKRLVKLNQKNISSFKELMDHYRIITLTEDDLFLIKGGPEVRRSFIDQAILLQDPLYGKMLREYKKVLDNRNSLLRAFKIDKDSFVVWTKLLWQKTAEIHKLRIQLLKDFENRINVMLTTIFDEQLQVCLEFRPKKEVIGKSVAVFLQDHEFSLKEVTCKRTLFGAHLDDILIKFQDKKSKNYASRGQQKLTVLLLKIAQLQHLQDKKGLATLLLDDFMTDFDELRLKKLISFLSTLSNQLIFTSPINKGLFDDLLMQLNAKKCSLNIQ